MASPLRTLMQCPSCVRHYLSAGFGDLSASSTGRTALSKYQIRSKSSASKKSNGNVVHVRLRKDVKTFGRAGSIVPIAPGRMRNEWFPRHIASYIPYTELRALRRQEVPMERDPDFDPALFAKAKSGSDADTGLSAVERQEASMFQSSPINFLTPERSKELLEIFVPSRLDFYRPAIIEEVSEPEQLEQEPNFGTGAGAELLAARSQAAKPKTTGQQSIYGSVSSHDVLVAIRAVMENSTDEAKRVVLHDGDVHFVGLKEGEHERVKHVGEFMVEIKVRGIEMGVKRIVRVHAQDAGEVVGSQKNVGVTA